MSAVCPESVESIRSGPGGFAPVRTLGNTQACAISLVRSAASGKLATIRRLHAFPKPAELRQLLAETNRLTGFEHPNVCPIVGAWVHDASVWCATEYTPGGSLAAILDYGQNHWEDVPQSVRLRILLDLTSGFAAVRSFDPQRLAMPLLGEDVWVSSKGNTQFLPLTNMPDTRRGALTDSAPRGLTENVRDVFFLACLWWETTTGKPLPKNSQQIPANVELSQPSAHFLLSVLTNPAGANSTAEFWKRALKTIETHEQVAERSEVATWVQAACPLHADDPVPEENAAQSSCRPQLEPETKLTRPSVSVASKLTQAEKAHHAQPVQTATRAQKRPAAPMLQQSSAGSATNSAALSENTTLESALVSWADSLPQPERPAYLDDAET